MPNEERAVDHGRAVALLTAWHNDDQESVRALLDEALTDDRRALSTILALVVQSTSAIAALAAATGSSPEAYLRTLGAETTELGYGEWD
jgi:DNA-binding phage protein